jgi:hypothetical protein
VCKNPRLPQKEQRMTKQAKTYIELAIESIQMFANDGKLDQPELSKLLDIANRDGQIDAEEKRVLTSIFTQAEKSGLSPEVAATVEKIRLRMG